MRAAAIAFLLLILASAGAQPTGGADSPAIAVLVHHPYPDASDPLGFEFQGSGADAYWMRYRHLDTDGVEGFDYPHTVFDGSIVIEGIPEGDGPFVATQKAYQAAFDARSDVETPIALAISMASGDDQVQVGLTVRSAADLGGEDLQAWVALVEDPVHYEPPPALSNGVFVHPFVVRAIAPVGDIEGLGNDTFARSFTVQDGDGPEAWNVDHLRAVAWVQQGASDGLRFDAHEVVQAVMQDPDAAVTQATQKVVLMEMYSATWCDTCLFGDRVAEELAEAHGVARNLELESTGYLREGPWLLAMGAGLLAAVAVAWPRLPGGKP